jgi:hypothetical protein
VKGLRELAAAEAADLKPVQDKVTCLRAPYEQAHNTKIWWAHGYVLNCQCLRANERLSAGCAMPALDLL